MEWLNGDERWRADIGKKESKKIVHEMKRWTEGKIGRERQRESHLTRVMWCISRCCISPLLPLALFLSAMQFSATYALTTDSCSPWERETGTRQHKWQQDWALCQTTWLQTLQFYCIHMHKSKSKHQCYKCFKRSLFGTVSCVFFSLYTQLQADKIKVLPYIFCSSWFNDV